MAQLTRTMTFFEGHWIEGNPGLIGPRSHAMWMGTVVFDGARWFEGLAPDLHRHAERVNHSAHALGLQPTVSADEIVALAWEGVAKFDGKTALYIRPMYWAEEGDFLSVPADPASTRFCLCLYEAPLFEPTGFSVTVSPFRRPTPESMPTLAKAACLYPNNARAIVEARSRGFDNALVRDMLGNVAETATSNIFMVRNGVVYTPAPNGSFLDGITRQRIIAVLRKDNITVKETTLTVADFMNADEIFATGNYSKVSPITRIEDRSLQPGPIQNRARELYWEFAREEGAGRH